MTSFSSEKRRSNLYYRHVYTDLWQRSSHIRDFIVHLIVRDQDLSLMILSVYSNRRIFKILRSFKTKSWNTTTLLIWCCERVVRYDLQLFNLISWFFLKLRLKKTAQVRECSIFNMSYVMNLFLDCIDLFCRLLMTRTLDKNWWIDWMRDFKKIIFDSIYCFWIKNLQLMILIAWMIYEQVFIYDRECFKTTDLLSRLFWLSHSFLNWSLFFYLTLVCFTVKR